MSDRVKVTLFLDLSKSLDDIGKEWLRDQIHTCIEKVENVSGVHSSMIGNVDTATVEEVASLGGVARAEKLSPEERSAIASKAAKARWEKEKGTS